MATRLHLLSQLTTDAAIAIGFVAIAWMATQGVTDPNVGPYGAVVALGGGKLAKDYYNGRTPTPTDGGA